MLRKKYVVYIGWQDKEMEGVVLMKGGGEVKGEPQCSDKGNLPFPEMIEFALRARSELAGCISEVSADGHLVHGIVRLAKETCMNSSIQNPGL